MPSVTTVWATDFPVSVTENPVTLTVEPETPARHRLGVVDFRDFLREISKCLTKGVANSPLCIVS